ncbi:MAG: hypothetical protein H6R27_817 [Proteobacteria bacterium]|nr:hypothetical protein [Pseudomonadota bacterium]
MLASQLARLDHAGPWGLLGQHQSGPPGRRPAGRSRVTPGGTAHRGRFVSRSVAAVAVVVNVLVPCTPAAAAELREAEADVVHFAFATQLGSGVYAVNGRTLQIYRLPVSWRLSEPADGRPGIRLRLPVTIGLYDFEPRDMIDSGIPERLDTLSVAGGIELDFELGGDWHLLPYVEAGRAWEAASATDATLYSAALHLHREWERGDQLRRLYTGIVYAGVDLDGSLGTADLLKVEAGAESRRPLGFDLAGEQADSGVYLLAEWYPDQPEQPVVRSAEGSNDLPFQVEIGVTLGTTEPVRVWGLPLPRVGLAYRFGEGLSVYRLVFGAPF